MENRTCTNERISKFALSVIFFLISLFFVVIGLTALPIFGLIVAAPFLGGAIYFLRAHIDENCQIVL